MLPKKVRDQRQEAKKSLANFKRIIHRMDDYLSSSDTKAILVAASFFHILEHHIETGDLCPDNLHLSALLRHKELYDEHA